MGLVQEETLVVFYTRMPRETVRTTWTEVWRYARNPHLEQAYSSVPKVKKQTDGKSLNSLKASPETRAKQFLVYGGQDEKDRRVTIDIIPCVVVTNLETDAFMAIVAYFDMLKVRSNLRERSRKEGTQG